MMEQKYVSKELAIKLKQLGFDWPVRNHYGVHETNVYDNIGLVNSNLRTARTSAPIIETAATWLREVKGLHVYAIPYDNSWGANVVDLKTLIPKMIILKVQPDHDTALTAGIEHAVDYLLKQKNNIM